MSEEASKAPGRPMRYPYTWSAKIAQFPLRFYINNNPLWKYYFLGVIAAIPVFYKIDRLGKFQQKISVAKKLLLIKLIFFTANSPESVAKWAESKRKEAAEHHH